MGKELAVALGALIRERRLKNRMTQLELAHRLGYSSTQFVSNVECGKAGVPQHLIGQLVIILGIPEKKIKAAIVTEFAEQLTVAVEKGKKKAIKKRLGT